jgi:hypothetical protein
VSQGVHDLTLSVNVGVQETDNVLELVLLENCDGLKNKQHRQTVVLNGWMDGWQTIISSCTLTILQRRKRGKSGQPVRFKIGLHCTPKFSAVLK